MVIIKNPDKVLDNFRSLSVPKKFSPNYLYALKSSNLKKYKNSLDYMNLIYMKILRFQRIFTS